jgi:uncharacterized cupin superfamily protein
MPNIFDPTWDAERDEPPYRWRRAFLGRQAGLERLGASLFELPPGAASFPLHVHLHNEELLVVLAGRPTLRTVDDERVLEPGDVVGCPAGRRGAHRLDNAGDEPVRVMVVSTMLAPEIVEFPDEGVFWVRDYVPGTDRPEGAVDVRLRPES